MKDILMTALFIVVTIYNIFKNRKILKELTRSQMIGTGISYLVAIFLAFVLIYYGGNWIVAHFSNIIFKYIMFLAIVCIALYLCVSTLNKALQKITNGVLPKS